MRFPFSGNFAINLPATSPIKYVKSSMSAYGFKYNFFRDVGSESASFKQQVIISTNRFIAIGLSAKSYTLSSFKT